MVMMKEEEYNRRSIGTMCWELDGEEELILGLSRAVVQKNYKVR